VTLLRRVGAAVHGGADPSALRAAGVEPERIIDFSSNQAPLGPAPAVGPAVAAAVLDAYPDPRAAGFCAAAATRHGVPAACVVAGNGSTELIRLIAQLALAAGDVALSLGPSFGEYEVATRLAGARLAEVRPVHRAAGKGFRCDDEALRSALAGERPRLCWLCSPHNPTGLALPPALIAELIAAHPQALFVLDEAYCDLLREPQWSQSLLARGNLVVLRSMTKSWGLAGLRLGYALTDAETAAALRVAAPPWSVNACAQAAGVAALADAQHHERGLVLLRRERDRLTSALRDRGWVVEPSAAAFFLVDTGDAAAARAALLAHGCLVRDCSSFGLPRHVRLSPRRPNENDRLLAAFAHLRPPAQ
jgi:histidinol-phosphate aminotransferase